MFRHTVGLLSCFMLSLLACGGQVEGDASSTDSALTGTAGLLAGETPAVVADSAGVLHVFARGADYGLYHATQGPSGVSAWTSMGITLQTPATAALGLGGRIEVFAIATDHGLWRTVQNTPGGAFPSTWQRLLSGPVVGRPVVARAYNGKLDVFVGSTQFHGFTHVSEASDGSFGAATHIATTLYSVARATAVTRSLDGRIEIYAVSKSTAAPRYGLFEVIEDAPGSPTFSEAQFIQDVSGFAVDTTDKGANLVFTASNLRGELQQRTESVWPAQSWSTPVVLGPGVGLPAVLKTRVFAASPNGYLEELTPTGTVNLGGLLASAPGVVASPGRVTVFAQLSDHALWARSQSTTSTGAAVWGAWTPFGSP